MADFMFDGSEYFAVPEGTAMRMTLLPNVDNRIHLALFIEDKTYEGDEDDGPMWLPYGGDGYHLDAVTTLGGTDIPCDKNAPLAFVDYKRTENFRSSTPESQAKLVKLLTDTGLAYEAVPYKVSKQRIYPAVFKFDIEALKKIDEQGATRWLENADKRVEHATLGQRVKFSDKFPFMGQVLSTNTVVFKTPYQIDGKDVYLEAGEYALKHPHDPGNFKLYTTDKTEGEVKAMFSIDLSSEHEFVIPRGAVGSIDLSTFTYSDATRGAENYSSFNKPIKNRLTGEVVTKEEMTHEIGNYIQSYHYELHLERDLNRELWLERDRQMPEPEREDTIAPAMAIEIPEMVPEPEYQEMEPEMGGSYREFEMN